MDESKPWYASQTVWASIIQVGVGLGVSLHLFDSAAGAAIATEGPGLLVGIATTVLGVWSFYGRVKASKTIG
jgi:hypothetical protein